MPEWMTVEKECWHSWRGFWSPVTFKTAEDLFGGPQGSPRTDAMVAAAVQWADRIMRKIDGVFGATENEVSK